MFNWNWFLRILSKSMKLTEIFYFFLLVPASAPENITYRNISSMEIELSFFPPSIPNGIVQTYTIYLVRTNGTEQRVMNTTLLTLRIAGQYIMIWNLGQLWVFLGSVQQTEIYQFIGWTWFFSPLQKVFCTLSWKITCVLS